MICAPSAQITSSRATPWVAAASAPADRQPASSTHGVDLLPLKRNGAPEGAPLWVPTGDRAAYRRLAIALAKLMVVPVPPRSPVSESLASMVATMALRRRSAFSG